MFTAKRNGPIYIGGANGWGSYVSARINAIKRVLCSDCAKCVLWFVVIMGMVAAAGIGMGV